MRKSLEDISLLVNKIPYHSELPNELIPFHYYILDSGHTILCVPKCFLPAAWESPDDYEVPIPVKYVLEKGYEIISDRVIIDVPYDSIFGVDVDDEYREYEKEV